MARPRPCTADLADATPLYSTPTPSSANVYVSAAPLWLCSLRPPGTEQDTCLFVSRKPSILLIGWFDHDQTRFITRGNHRQFLQREIVLVLPPETWVHIFVTKPTVNKCIRSEGMSIEHNILEPLTIYVRIVKYTIANFIFTIIPFEFQTSWLSILLRLV